MCGKTRPGLHLLNHINVFEIKGFGSQIVLINYFICNYMCNPSLKQLNLILTLLDTIRNPWSLCDGQNKSFLKHVSYFGRSACMRIC